MKKKIFVSAVILFLLVVGNIYSQQKVEFLRNQYPNVVQAQIRFDANNIDTWIQNTGIFNQDIRSSNTPGLMWKKGTNRFACFTAGLTMAAYIDGQLKMAAASYQGEYAPGYINISGGVPVSYTHLTLPTIYSV